jgi:membrane-associated phospholipid phosphatase
MPLPKTWIGRHAGALAAVFAGVLAPLTLLAAVAEDVHEHAALPFDHAVQMLVHAHATPLLDTVMYCVTVAGSALFLVPFNLLVFGALWRHGRRADAAFWAVAVIGTAAINFAAKNFFARVRPGLWVSRVHETTYSFPSGHAMSTMAAVAALCALVWPTRWRWTAIGAGSVYVLAVGMSRVYLGVHYPSDVLAGWAASLALVIGTKMLFDRARAGRTGENKGQITTM